jgi:hypothetical protein
VSTHRRVVHSQVRRDLMGQRFKTFKPFNRCAPFKSLGRVGSRRSNDSSSSRRFAPFSSAGLEHREAPTTKRAARVTLAGSQGVPVRAGPRLRDPTSVA